MQQVTKMSPNNTGDNNKSKLSILFSLTHFCCIKFKTVQLLLLVLLNSIPLLQILLHLYKGLTPIPFTCFPSTTLFNNATSPTPAITYSITLTTLFATSNHSHVHLFPITTTSSFSFSFIAFPATTPTTIYIFVYVSLLYTILCNAINLLLINSSPGKNLWGGSPKGVLSWVGHNSVSFKSLTPPFTLCIYTKLVLSCCSFVFYVWLHY